MAFIILFLHTQGFLCNREGLVCEHGGLLTVEVGGDGVAGEQAVDGNLIDDVEQQKGQTGEAQRLEQTTCVA